MSGGSSYDEGYAAGYQAFHDRLVAINDQFKRAELDAISGPLIVHFATMPNWKVEDTRGYVAAILATHRKGTPLEAFLTIRNRDRKEIAR